MKIYTTDKFIIETADSGLTLKDLAFNAELTKQLEISTLERQDQKRTRTDFEMFQWVAFFIASRISDNKESQKMARFLITNPFVKVS